MPGLTVLNVNKENMEKRICTNCDRVLQKTTHDKCMYCGAEIPIELRLSDEQKNKIAEKQQEEHKKQMKNSSPSSPDNDDSIISLGIIMGGDISGGSDCD